MSRSPKARQLAGLAAVALILGQASLAAAASPALLTDGPAPLLQSGDSGRDVAVLQGDLRALGYTATGAADGIFGPHTRQGVLAFQGDQGLRTTGSADTATWAALHRALGGRTIGSVPLSAWDRGPAVAMLQGDLDQFGDDPGPVDGILGPQTTAALQAFQRTHGVGATGILGPQTFGALLAALDGGAAQTSPTTTGTGTIDGRPVERHIAMVATAYGPSLADNYPFGPVDAFGDPLAAGMVAVDPRVIPLHSHLWVSGYSSPNLPAGGFLAEALDTGGAIKGDRIDIFINGDPATVSAFGIQNVQVAVLGN